MIKKEQQRQRDEAQFTYQPIIFTQRSPSSQRMSREQENRFEKLYGDAVKRQITGKIVQQVAKDVVYDRDLTFSPRLSKKGANLSRSASRERLGISRSSSCSEVGSIASTARTFRSRSPSPARSEFSFSPQITKKAQLSADRRSLSAEQFFSDEPSTSRLYRQAAVLQEKAAIKKEEFEQLSMQECTFAPRLATSRASVTRKVQEEQQYGNGLDVSERLMRREHIRKIKLEQAKLELDAKQRENLTFKPQIKELKSRSSSPARPADVVERLLTPTAKSRNAEIAEAEANAQLTFHPKIPSRRSASPNTVRGQVYSSVHEKLFVEGVHHQREKDTESERQRAELPAEYTFRPQLRSRSGTPKSFDGQDDHSSVGSRSSTVDSTALFARLAYQEKINPVRQQKLEKEMAHMMPFKPTISEKSRELHALRNSNTPIHQRLKEKGDKCAAELAAKRERLAKQRAEEDARSMRNPQLSIRSLELVAQYRRSHSASPSPQKRQSTVPRSPATNTGLQAVTRDEEDDADESVAPYEMEEDTSVFPRLSEQHTSSSTRRRSLAARENLLDRDDSQGSHLPTDDASDDANNHINQRSVQGDDHKHFVRASAMRTLSGRDLHHMVQRLAVPYPRENRPANSFIEPENHRLSSQTVPSIVLPNSVIHAAATRLNQKTTRAFRLATDEALRQEEQEKTISENIYAQYTPKKMSEPQRDSLFQRLAAGEQRTDVRDVIRTPSFAIKRNAPSPSPSDSRGRSSSANAHATPKAAQSPSTPSTSRRSRSRSEEEGDDNCSDAGSVSTVGSVHSVKSNASFRSLQSNSSASKSKSTASTSRTNTSTTGSKTAATTTQQQRKSTASTSVPLSASPSVRSEVKTVEKTPTVALTSWSSSNSRSATPTQKRATTSGASSGSNSRSSTPQQVRSSASHHSSNQSHGGSSGANNHKPIASSTVNGGKSVALRGTGSGKSTPKPTADAVATADTAPVATEAANVTTTTTNSLAIETVQARDTTVTFAESIIVKPESKSPTANAAPNVRKSPSSTSSQASMLLARKSSAERLLHMHAQSPALGRKPSNSRIPMLSPTPSPSQAHIQSPTPSQRVQHEWVGSKQNTSKRPSDDFEAKLQASLAMLKPLDDLLASPIISHSSSSKRMAPEK
jgi:hypothetical protein